MNTTISLDWDYVTGDCIASGEAHCGFCANAVKDGVGQRGYSSYMCEDWKSRFTELCKLDYPTGTPFYVAECHADIFGILRSPIGGNLCIFDFDSHYDDYPDEMSFINCGNWIAYARRLYKLKVCSRKNSNSLAFRCKISEAKSDISVVFLCKSSPWTPDSLDNKFYELVRFISKRMKTPPIFIGHMAPKLAEDSEHYKNHTV